MKYTLYWRYRSCRQVIEGPTIEAAFNAAGYGAGAIKAVDFYVNGDNDNYEWNATTHSWDRKPETGDSND